jgi:molybdenum cofactor synthesis domain-containing protein
VFQKPYTYAPLRAQDKSPIWDRESSAGLADFSAVHASLMLGRGEFRLLRLRRDWTMTKPTTVTAAVLVIGDEILSGRTKDRNLGYIAEYLAKIGVDVREARVVPDVEDDIVAAINVLRARYDYLVTTGGIGPTHDDITADAIGRAFGVPVGEDPRAIAIMLERYAPADLTPARRRMARIPEGADLIENPISRAPGFRIGNVFVLAGVPAVMQAMLDFAAKAMNTGAVMLVEVIAAGSLPEGRYGDALGAIAAAHPNVAIGSYPSFKDGRFNNQIVVRGKDEEAVAAGRRAVEAMVAAMSQDAAAH